MVLGLTSGRASGERVDLLLQLRLRSKAGLGPSAPASPHQAPGTLGGLPCGSSPAATRALCRLSRAHPLDRHRSQCWPRAQGLCWASPRFSWLAARLGLLAPQLTSQFQSQWCLDHWTGFPGHLPPAVTAGGAARSETGVCSFRRQQVGGEGSILRHL